MKIENIYRFIEIYLSVFVSTIFINFINLKIDKFKRKNKVIHLIGEDLLKVCNPQKSKSLSFKLQKNKIFEADLQNFIEITDKYLLLVKPLNKRYIDIKNIINCMSEIVTIIKSNYIPDLRYQSAIIIDVDNLGDGEEWIILEKLNKKLETYKNLADKVYAKLIYKYPEILESDLREKVS